MYPILSNASPLYVAALLGLRITLMFINSHGKGVVVFALGVAFTTIFPLKVNYRLVLFFQMNP
jgi:hypothetical protein